MRPVALLAALAATGATGATAASAREAVIVVRPGAEADTHFLAPLEYEGQAHAPASREARPVGGLPEAVPRRRLMHGAAPVAPSLPAPGVPASALGEIVLPPAPAPPSAPVTFTPAPPVAAAAPAPHATAGATGAAAGATGAAAGATGAAAREAVIVVRPGAEADADFLAPLEREGEAANPAAREARPVGAIPGIVTRRTASPVPFASAPLAPFPPEPGIPASATGEIALPFLPPPPVEPAAPEPPAVVAPPDIPTSPLPEGDAYRLAGRVLSPSLDGTLLPLAGARLEVYERSTDFLDPTAIRASADLLDRFRSDDEGRFLSEEISVDDGDGPWMGRSDPVLLLVPRDGPPLFLFHAKDIRPGIHDLGDIAPSNP